MAALGPEVQYGENTAGSAGVGGAGPAGDTGFAGMGRGGFVAAAGDTEIAGKHRGELVAAAAAADVPFAVDHLGNLHQKLGADSVMGLPFCFPLTFLSEPSPTTTKKK